MLLEIYTGARNGVVPLEFYAKVFMYGIPCYLNRSLTRALDTGA